MVSVAFSLLTGGLVSVLGRRPRMWRPASGLLVLLLPGIAMAASPVPPDASAFTGSWSLRSAAGGAACKVVLQREPATQGARRGHRLQASGDCLRKLKAPAFTIWRPETEGVVIEGAEPQEVLLFAQTGAGRYVARDRTGRAVFVLERC